MIPSTVVLMVQYWDQKGGPSTYCRKLLRCLSDKGVRCSVLTLEQTPDPQVVALGAFNLRVIIEALMKLVAMRPRTIQVHGHGPLLGIAFLYKCVFRKVRLLFTFHTEPLVAKSWLSRKILGFLLSGCDETCVVSADLGKKVQSIGKIKLKRAPIVTPPGFLPEDVERRDTLQGAPNRGPALLSINVMAYPEKTKGLILLLRALPDLLDEWPGISLLIIGDGPCRHEVEAEVDALCLRPFVHFAGRVDNVFPYLCKADIFIHATFQDSFPIAILEAMGAGLPVIASRVGGIPELIGGCGVLVENTVASFVGAIRGLLENPSMLKDLGASAQTRANEYFTWEILINKMIEVLDVA